MGETEFISPPQHGQSSPGKASIEAQEDFVSECVRGKEREGEGERDLSLSCLALCEC